MSGFGIWIVLTFCMVLLLVNSWVPIVLFQMQRLICQHEMKNLNWYHLRDSRLTIWQYTLSFFSHSFSQAAKNVAAQNVEGPMKAMADIRLRLEHGASVNEVNAAYEAHEFPELEKVDSQMLFFTCYSFHWFLSLSHHIMTSPLSTRLPSWSWTFSCWS